MAARAPLTNHFRGALAVCVGLICSASGLMAQEHSPAMPDWRYSVRPGDTLLGLAQRYLREPVAWTRVQKLNRIGDPHRIPVGTVLRIPADLLRVAPASVTVRALHGTVRWREHPGNDWKALRPGQMLQAGAQVQTEAHSSSLLALANGTEILCQPQSLLSLDALSAYAGGLMADSRLRLQSGQAEIRTPAAGLLQQRMRVLTPGAQATVRGTVFRVGVEEQQTREETVSGSVSLGAAGQEVHVNEGQGTVVAEGAAPLPPRPLLSAPALGAWPTLVEHLPLRLPLPARAGVSRWWGQALASDTPETVLAQGRGTAQGISFEDLPNGELVLRVRGIDNVGLQGLEAQHRVRVHARPFAPLPLEPNNGKVVHEPRASLRWSQPTGASRYRLQLAHTSDFAVAVHDIQTDALAWAPEADVAVEQLLHWRVASIDSQGVQGPWSTGASFRHRPAPQLPQLDAQSVRRVAGRLEVHLPPPPPHQHYALAVAPAAQHLAQMPVTVSRDGRASLDPPSGATVFLAVRAVSDDDGSAGPAAVQRIHLPTPAPQPWWMLLLPLLLLL